MHFHMINEVNIGRNFKEKFSDPELFSKDEDIVIVS